MNKLLYFTTCYVRDLPYANRLFGSMKKYTSDIDFVVVLIDEEGNIPTNFDYDFRILSMNSINREILTELSNRYNWDELKNNCKPFVFSHLLKEEKQVIYLDCSTVIHQSVDIFDKTLASHNAFVVPQLLFAHQHPKENDALNFGVFHNGCMGFNASETTDKWIEWWQNHTRFKGYFDPCKGMNTDRLCLEFAPIFFKNTHAHMESYNCNQPLIVVLCVVALFLVCTSWSCSDQKLAPLVPMEHTGPILHDGMGREGPTPQMQMLRMT
ncbi:MAG: hypothetical protein QMB03_11920, partial [Spirosomataceae bacterium]